MLTAVMVGVSYFCTTQPGLKSKVFGWIGVGFFSLGFIVLPRQLVRSGIQFIVDEHGLEDRRSKIGLIEWRDVLSVSVGTIHRQQLLCVHVRDPEKYLDRLSKAGIMIARANERLRFPPITLAFSGLSRSPAEVHAFVQKNYPVKR